MIKTIVDYRSILRQSIVFLHKQVQCDPQNNVAKITSAGKGRYEIINEKFFDDTANKIPTQLKTPSVLETCQEDITHVSTYLKPTFNFSAYINKSETLKKLLELGVELYKIENRKDVPQFLMGLDFERDIKEHVLFLHDVGLQLEDIGKFITKNPMIFNESIENLRCRINYLKVKKFDEQMIARIVSSNPKWLEFSSQQIDDRLGFFQRQFHLTGNEVRQLVTKRPRLITYKLRQITMNYFVLKEEMGFNDDELKHILLEKPVVYTKHPNKMLKTFEYLHKEIGVSLETIARTPGVLTCRYHKLRERYLFLKKLNHVQLNPKEPNYISILTMVSGNDADFATEVAKSSSQAYNSFLRTL